MEHPYGCFANYLSHYAYQLSQTNANPNANATSFQANVVQGLQTFVIIEAIRRSAQLNQVVNIKDIKSEVYAESSNVGGE